MSKAQFTAWPKPSPEEEIEELKREQHEGRMCEGAPKCGYCLDELDAADEEEKSRGRYDSNGHWVRE
jgi:hypothetical protein